MSYPLRMDAKKTIAKLKGEADRIRMSLYLSQSIYEDFKKVCGEISPSRVVEELMKEFIEDAKKPKQSSRSSKSSRSKD